MKIPNRLNVKKMNKTYGLTSRALCLLDEIDDECDGFDQLNDAYLNLESALFCLHHTIYVAEKRQEELS